jgi:hypothetical protein
MADPSYLDVTAETDSNFLRTHTPYIVRDARMAVVHEGTTGDAPVELPPGLYSVEMLAPSGAPVRSVIQLSPGETANVPTLGERVAEPVNVPAPEKKNFPPPPPPMPPMARSDVEIAEQLPTGGAAQLIATKLCTSEPVADASWRFSTDQALRAVPTAAFSLGDRRIEMSLPLNPLGGSPELSGCQVSGVWEAGRQRLRMSFAPGRRLCVAMDGLLRHNTESAAADLFDGASDLLLGKYSDPPGAALGGLTLHRLGRLPERRGWIGNLSDDFGWLPDGQILHAALLMKEPEPPDRTRGLDILLAATANRPLYTDGLSLALELLRRWPDDDRVDERTERLNRLAVYSAYAEWDSINLSVDITGQGRQ